MASGANWFCQFQQRFWTDLCAIIAGQQNSVKTDPMASPPEIRRHLIPINFPLKQRPQRAGCTALTFMWTASFIVHHNTGTHLASHPCAGLPKLTFSTLFVSNFGVAGASAASASWLWRCLLGRHRLALFLLLLFRWRRLRGCLFSSHRLAFFLFPPTAGAGAAGAASVAASSASAGFSNFFAFFFLHCLRFLRLAACGSTCPRCSFLSAGTFVVIVRILQWTAVHDHDIALAVVHDYNLALPLKV